MHRLPRRDEGLQRIFRLMPCKNFLRRCVQGRLVDELRNNPIPFCGAILPPFGFRCFKSDGKSIVRAARRVVGYP